MSRAGAIGRGRLRVLLAAAALAACARPADLEKAPGDVDVVVLTRAGADAPVPLVAFVHVTGVTSRGAAIDAWVECVQEPEHLEAELDALPPGSYRAAGRAFAVRPDDPAAAVPDYASAADAVFTVTPGCTRLSILVLDPVAAVAAAAGNRSPRIHAVTASAPAVDPTSGPGVALSAVAGDPDGAHDLASVSWSEEFIPSVEAPAELASRRPLAAAGGFTTTTGASTTWTPPAGTEGVAALTVTATDRGGATSAVTFVVASTTSSAPGAISLTARLNAWPEVSAVRAAPAQVAPGGTAAVSATAVDPDGDPLAYAWDDGGCGGTFGAPAARSTTWTAPGAPASCTLRVTVRDLQKGTTTPRGGVNRGTLVVSVSSPAPVLAPSFDYAWMSPAPPVIAGTPVSFAVSAVEASGAPVATILWSDGAGGAFTPATAGSAAWVRWTAPGCGAAASRSLTVTATAVGAADSPSAPARSTFPFPVTVVCP